MSTVIKIENVSKRYRVRTQLGYVSFKEMFGGYLGRLTSRQERPPSHRELWALRDFQADIRAGELIGLVGLNGSGKSTLLKLLAEVTKPTTGSITIWGRVGSLLEVGTGFHPELTGRENVYLSGSILGMRWKEISRKFDEIVAFAEMEGNLDMQVKRYSSGMYLRLAFSVAAHLDPEILLVDEALSVGDLNFRRKCVAKMQKIVRSGATVLFVSHNMGLMAETCDRCLLLEKGHLMADGPAASVIQRYLQSATRQTALDFGPENGRYFRRLEVNRGKPAVFAQRFDLEVGMANLSDKKTISLGYGFCNLDGTRILSCEGGAISLRELETSPGQWTLAGGLPSLPLTPGVYLLDLVLRDEENQVLEHRLSCAQVEILAGDGTAGFFLPEAGGVRVTSTWQQDSSRLKSERAQGEIA